MKKNFLFSVLCLLLTVFSFNVNAQIGGFGMVATPTHCSDNYEVNWYIQQTVWDADISDWSAIADLPPSYFPDDLPKDFHAIVLAIPYQTLDWNIVRSFEFDVDIYQYGGSLKPVMLFYRDYAGVISGGIEVVTDAQGFFTGFKITRPINGGGGGGIATTAVIAGRGYSPTGTGCMEVRTTNVLGTPVNGFATCRCPNDSDMVCGSGVHGRMAQSSTDVSAVNIYPNPVQDNLFVETDGLDIQDVNFVTMNGQNINSKVSIRNGIDRLQINTSQLQPGIYLLRLETSDEPIIEKIIVR